MFRKQISVIGFLPQFKKKLAALTQTHPILSNSYFPEDNYSVSRRGDACFALFPTFDVQA